MFEKFAFTSPSRPLKFSGHPRIELVKGVQFFLKFVICILALDLQSRGQGAFVNCEGIEREMNPLDHFEASQASQTEKRRS